MNYLKELRSDCTPIIILNWNGLNDTIECMDSLLSVKNENFHIILVDNGSGNNEGKILKDKYGNQDNVSVILNKLNKGFTRGNNDIVEELLKTAFPPKYVILLNNDTVISPPWFEELVSTAEELDADIITSKMINYYDRRKIDNLGHQMLNTGEILPIAHNLDKNNFQQRFENLGACGGAALYRTSMIREIGFFDSHFNTGYEDAEFGLRAKLLGYKCVYEPKAVVYHKVSRSINKIKDDQYLQDIQLNIFYTYVKLMPSRFLFANISFVILKYFLWFFLGVLTGQFKLIYLHSGTLTTFLKRDIKQALTKRRQFYNIFGDKLKYRRNFLKPATFFLIPDIMRVLTRI